LAACGGSSNESAPQLTSAATTTAAAAPEAPPAEAAPAEATPTEATPLPQQPGSLAAGRYTTTILEPRLSFDVPDGLSLPIPEFLDFVQLQKGSLADGASLAITRLDLQVGVVDPEARLDSPVIRAGVLQPLPDDLLAWEASNPRFEAGEIEDVTVAGEPGRAIEFDVLRGDGHAGCAGDACVGTLVADGGTFFTNVGDRQRDIVVELGGVPMLITITAPKDGFDAWRTEAEAILATLAVEPPAEVANDLSSGYLAPGLHATSQFEPGFSLKVPEGWHANVDSTGFVNIQSESGLVLAVVDMDAVERVYDPSKATPSPSDTIDRPADLTAWLREHPRFDAAKAKPVTVAGHEGVVWDTAVKAGAGGENCPRACVFLYQLDGQPIVDLEGSTTRSYVLDVDGRTVGVAILAPTHAFERLAPRAEAVLETLEFAA
jgi:hypothetical protein